MRKAIEVDEFIKQNPTIKMIVPKVPKSDLKAVGYIKSEQINNFDTAEYKPETPFEYARQTGVKMIFPNLESYKYILQSDNVQPSYNLSVPEETIGEFEYDFDEGILYWTGKKTAVRLTNFYVEIKERYLLESLQEQSEMIKLEVKNKNYCVELEIELERLSSLYQLLIKQYPEFLAYSDVGTGKVNQLLRQYISELYSTVKNALPFTVKYASHGWNVDERRHWHYFSGSDSNCFSDFRLAEYLTTEPVELIAWCYGLLQIGSLEIMLPMMIQMHMGFTLKLFEEAGYNEQYILTLIGESGSKKTSLARELFCLFG